MYIYAIKVEYLSNGTSAVSSECYVSLTKAIKFCESRNNVRKLSERVYMDHYNGIRYTIVDMRLV